MHASRLVLSGLAICGAALLSTSVRAQDECTGAIAVFNGANGPFSNVGMTTSVPAWPCGAGANDIWFSYVATCTGTVTVDTCGSGYDSTLEAFSGACGGLTSLACDDDGCGFPASRLTFSATASTTYFIRMGGFGGSTGTAPLNVSCAGSGGPPNEECTGAIGLGVGPNGPFSNAGSTTSAPGWPCGAGANDVWFFHTATCCGNLTIDTCGSGYDSTLEVFDFCGGTSLGCDDDGCGFPASRVTVSVALGQTVYVRMGGLGGSTGSAPINVSCVAAAPANEECIGAIPVVLGTNGPFNNNCSTTSVPAWLCSGVTNDVWFSFVANCTCPTTFDLCGANYDSAIELFDGTGGCAGIVSIRCNDDNFITGPCQFTLASYLTVPLVNGTTYYIRVGGVVGSTGTFPIEISTGTGLGSIAMTTATSCGVPGLALTVTGNPNIGGTVTTAISGFTGLPFVTWGFEPATTPLSPACPCLILTTSTSWQFVPSLSLTIPSFAGFIGLQLATQGADLFGAPAACGVPVPNAFTDIWTVTIG